jgi:anti-anti-sigma regulatory factor
MIKIEVHKSESQVMLQIEGELTGVFVPELEHCWQDIVKNRKRAVVTVDLQSLTDIDRDGRRLLRLMHQDGVNFVEARLSMLDVLDEVTGVN